MKKYTNLNSIITRFAAVIALGLIALPASASAATVYLEASRSTIAVGDTAIVAVKINADGAVLNTVDGSVSLKGSSGGKLVVQQFSLANSSFGLWPRTPSLSQDGSSISFVGGVPGGMSIEGATLFKIIVTATSTGKITITPGNTSVFANDGQGTKLPLQVKGIVITVVPKTSNSATVDDWSSVVATDTTPPQPFIVVLGRDPSIFDGKKFAFFSAVDNQSGIDHYDVSENAAAPVRSGSTYVLQDQNGTPQLTVTAYDKAGNQRVAFYPTGQPVQQGIAWLSIAVVVLLIVVVYVILKKISKKMKRNKNTPSSNAPTSN